MSAIRHISGSSVRYATKKFWELSLKDVVFRPQMAVPQVSLYQLTTYNKDIKSLNGGRFDISYFDAVKLSPSLSPVSLSTVMVPVGDIACRIGTGIDARHGSYPFVYRTHYSVLNSDEYDHDGEHNSQFDETRINLLCPGDIIVDYSNVLAPGHVELLERDEDVDPKYWSGECFDVNMNPLNNIRCHLSKWFNHEVQVVI
jgi:hypothetical protein